MDLDCICRLLNNPERFLRNDNFMVELTVGVDNLTYRLLSKYSSLHASSLHGRALHERDESLPVIQSDSFLDVHSFAFHYLIFFRLDRSNF